MNKNYLMIIIAMITALVFFFQSNNHRSTTPSTSNPPTTGSQSQQPQQPQTKKLSTDDTDKIQQAFKQQQSNIQVHATGKVKAILADDNHGSRHQKFILQLSSGQTVIVAHNIDLAKKIQHLKQGDDVEFYGEYEYTAKGGVIHWTHHDPQKRHIDGWLKHQQKTYQ